MATSVERALATMQAMKNGTVKNQVALKWAQAFWDVYGPGVDGNGDVIESPTSAQLAAFYVRELRKHHQRVMESSRVNSVANTVRDAEVATIAAEAATEIGDD